MANKSRLAWKQAIKTGLTKGLNLIGSDLCSNLSLKGLLKTTVSQLAISGTLMVKGGVT